MSDRFYYFKPLSWPTRIPRTDRATRLPSPASAVSIEEATDAVVLELKLHGLDRHTITVNSAPGAALPARGPTFPRGDPGVAIWFSQNDLPLALTCDRYQQAADNMAACAALLRRERGALSLPHDRDLNIGADMGGGMFAGNGLGDIAIVALALGAGLTLGLIPDAALDRYHGARKTIARRPGS